MKSKKAPVPSFEFGGQVYKPKLPIMNKRKQAVIPPREIVTEILDDGKPVPVKYGYER